MKNIRNLLALLLALTMLLGLCACGGEGETETTTESTTETTTETTTEATEPSGTTYKVTVVDESGAPVSGAMIQICLDACIPTTTNADGVAEWTVEEADYKVSFLTLPAGYTYVDDVQEFYFDGAYEMTITLKAEA